MSLVERTSDLFGRDIQGPDLRVVSIERSARKDERRYTTGLQNVDDSAGLMRPGGFVVVGARGGQGKTALIETLALANAPSHKVLLVTLDMRRDVIRDRLLAKSMQVSIDELEERADRNDAHYKRTLEAFSNDLLVWRPAKGSKRASDIMRYAEKSSAEIVIVDYCRLLDGWDYGRKAADIVDELADWAHDSAILTIMLTQLRDEAVNRRPHEGHIQDTSQLAQRADRVQLIYRPYLGKPTKDTLAEILTTKNRWGPPVKNHVGWIGETQSFYGFTGEEEYHARCCYRPDKK